MAPELPLLQLVEGVRRFPDAACEGRTEEMFPTSETPRYEVQLALELCRECPAIERCAAAGEGEQDGIWGGVLHKPKRNKRRSARS